MPDSSALLNESIAAQHVEESNAVPVAPPPCSTADVLRAAGLLDALVSATENLPVEAITVSILFYWAGPLDRGAVVLCECCGALLSEYYGVVKPQ